MDYTGALLGDETLAVSAINVNLGNGHSVLQASTSFTVTVAQGESLSRFASNERVERVRLIAGLGGQGQTELITVNGNTYIWPSNAVTMY